MQSTQRAQTVILILILAAVCSSYIMLFGKYRPSEIDDVWTASYVWTIVKHNSTEDTVLGFPSNVRYFGHIHAHIVGAVADFFGWSKSTFHAFNLTCMMLAALAWYCVARKLTGIPSRALLFVILLFALEPFIGASYKARSDALAFLFASCGVWAASRRRYFGAALLTSLGVEVHAIAGIGYFWILAFLLPELFPAGGRSREYKSSLFVLGGILVGLGVYHAVHPVPLQEILSYLARSNTVVYHPWLTFNALTSHYFTREYFRFLPELIFWATGAYLYCAHSGKIFSRQDRLLNLFWLTLAASVIIRRPNFHYVIFFYAPLMLLAVQGYAGSRLKNVAVACLIVYALSLSSLLFMQNRHVDHDSFDRQLAAIPLPEKELPVLGPANAWFVLRDRAFYAKYPAMVKRKPRHGDVLYYIAGPYSPPLPDCVTQEGDPLGEILFNRKTLPVLRMNLEQCP